MVGIALRALFNTVCTVLTVIGLFVLGEWIYDNTGAYRGLAIGIYLLISATFFRR